MTQNTDYVSPPVRDPEPCWGHSLSAGAPGIMLLHIEYARAGTGRWSTVQEWAEAMTRRPIPAHPDASGLYRGAPAVAFALHIAGQSAYASALNDLDSHITALTRHRLERAHERIDRGQMAAVREFDLISGLTGIGVYLLHRHCGGDLLGDVLAYLVRLADPLLVDGEALPGWWSGTRTDGKPSPLPGGHGNLGLAHGISGPLALLAAAKRRGVTVPGQAEAVSRICDWLDQWRVGSGRRAWWPGMISLAEWQDRTIRQPGPQRPSWCYGTPGLARAQQLAGLALDDPERQRCAEEALTGCVTDEGQLSLLRDVSLCHGWAGLTMAAWRVAADARSDGELAARVPRLLERIDRHLDRRGSPISGGMLEGTAGVRLAQQTIVANVSPVSTWDACLLLNG